MNNNLEVIDEYILKDINKDPDIAILDKYQYLYSDTKKNYQGVHSSHIKDDFKNMTIKNLIIPEGVTFIEANAFEGLNIERVSFPSTLIEISPNAFLNCKMLKEIEFRYGIKKSTYTAHTIASPEIKTIGSKAFKNTGLVKVNLPESLKSLSYDIFTDCVNLEECNIPSKITYLFSNFNNTKISSVDFSTNVEKISDNFFKDTLIKNTTILENIKELGNNCFSDSNLEVINIIGLNKKIGKQNNVTNLKEVNFSFKNKKNEIINYNHIKGKNRQIVSFSANEDGYLFIEKAIGFNVDTFLKKEEYTFYTKQGKNIIPLTKMQSYFDVNKKRFEYNLIDYQYGVGIPSIYKWIIAVEKKEEGNHQAFLTPSADIMKYLIDDDKIRIRYFVIEDKYNKLYKMFNKNGEVKTKEFVNFCYLMGLFSDNKEEHESAYDFLERISNLDMNNYLKTFINIDNFKMIDVKYNKNFANFFKQTFVDTNSFKEGDVDFTRKIYENFTNIYNSIKNNKEITKEAIFRYLTENKYMYNPGNETLAMLASNYSEKYDQKDFDRLQTIFELGKKVTKKIIQTKDQEINGVTYLWSPGNNPVNLFLGHEDKADCCAKLNGAAESIMVNAITNPNIQNLILFDEHKNIIGKTTAYYNEDSNYILFNNVEVNKNYLSPENQKKILLAFKRAISDQVNALENTKPLEKVGVGMKVNDIHDAIKAEHEIIKDPEAFLENFEYKNYGGDASHTSYGQAIIYKRR